MVKDNMGLLIVTPLRLIEDVNIMPFSELHFHIVDEVIVRERVVR